MIVILLLRSGLIVSAKISEEDTVCIKPFFEGVISKDELVYFFEKDTALKGAYCTPSYYAHILKVFNRKNQISIERPILYVKEMSDTVMYFDHVEVCMASRECGEGVYFFRTVLNGFYRVFTYKGIPKILAHGGYIIELFNENAFDGYYESSGVRKDIILNIPINHQIHRADEIK